VGLPRPPAPAWSAWLAARRTGVAFVTTWHGVYGEDLPGKRLYNGVMARGDRVIAISRYVAGRVAEGYAVPPSRLRVIPRGVDPAVFDPLQVSGERVHRLAQAWRIPAGARVVMLPARLTRWKGALTLLDAMARLPSDADGELFCVLVGGDQGRDGFSRKVEAHARRLGVAPRLRLAGHCEDMPAALMLGDVVVSASLKPEPFGRAVIEAQAMGRPVVAFDHGGAAETVAEGRTGLLVPPGDAAALAASLARALALPAEDRAALGRRAREAVLAGYTTAAMQAATLDVYRELLDR
jgi:glycosyltransferase involved in cell wall biosynthesis